MLMTSQESARAAVLNRDRTFDGEFVFAVRSTHIYCRPSCPARRPRLEHVEFFPTPAAAEQAGYRACLRCRPADAAAPAIVWLTRARAYLDAHLDRAPSLMGVARRVGLSPSHVQRTFKKAFGVSPKQYVLEQRAIRLKQALRRTATVTDAQYEAGYGAPSRAYTAADRHLAMTPATYQQGGRGAEILYTTLSTRFGRLLVAATGRGVCAVALGAADAELERALAAEYPAAKRHRADVAADSPFRRWVSSVVDHLAGKTSEIRVPVEVAATAFQRRVWRALQEIPYGETRTYGELAKAIGQPRAARAVGRACASNPIALVVPCHRAVPETGAPGKYRWGAERKRALLEKERT